MQTQNRYLSVKKIEEIYAINPNKVYWWVRNGKIIYTKIGKTLLIPEVEFRQFLERNTVDKNQIPTLVK